MRLVVDSIRLTLKRPLVTAWGELRERELLHVTLTDGDGLFGCGEAAGLEPYDGVAPAALRAALDAYAAVPGGAPPGAGPPGPAPPPRGPRPRRPGAGTPPPPPAAPSVTSRRRSPPSTSRSGT